MVQKSTKCKQHAICDFYQVIIRYVLQYPVFSIPSYGKMTTHHVNCFTSENSKTLFCCQVRLMFDGKFSPHDIITFK